MLRTTSLVAVCLVMIALAGGMCSAQQPAPTDIRQLVPSRSVLVVGYDGRPENPSVQAIAKAQDPATQEQRVKQQEALCKAVENFVTLFGISLDFAKDIDSWAGRQWILAVLLDNDRKPQPVFMTASSDATTASAALRKILAPFGRVGQVSALDDSEYPITGFATGDGSVQVYASAYGSVVALSPSISCLKEALKGGGLPVDSPGDKALKALGDSAFYAFVDPALLKLLMHADLPVTGFGLGFSATETGTKVRALGYPAMELNVVMKQMLSSRQAGVLTANPGIPSTSLLAASLPDVSGLIAFAGVAGFSKNPLFATIAAIGDTQVSGAVTAVLPTPTGAISAMASSDAAAAEKLKLITINLTQLELPIKLVTLPSGIPAVAIGSPQPAMFLAQIGKHLVLALDAQSIATAAATIKGDQPNIGQSEDYQQTMAGLGDSNLLTVYANMAPIRGLGFLAEGLGLGQVQPIFGSLATMLENLRAMGLGIGYDGEAVSATIFVRAKPGTGASIGPIVATSAAVGAAVLFPVFARAQAAAEKSACMSNLKELPLSAMMYAGDHRGILPASAKWQDQLEQYIRGDLDCPSGGAAYAFNKNLGGLNLDKILNPSEVVMFFEAAPDLPNATGSRANAILPHDGRGAFAYADGHVKMETQVPDQSHWVPKYAKPTKPAAKAPAKGKPARVGPLGHDGE